jgi:cell division protein FtsB
MSYKQGISLILIKIGLIAGIVILGLVIASIYRETKQKQQKQAIIDTLIEEKNRISRDNSMMQEKLTYYSSQEYAEKKSKELNMQKPDEHLIVVRPNIAKEIPVEMPIESNGMEIKTIVPNYKKWWNYLFEY